MQLEPLGLAFPLQTVSWGCGPVTAVLSEYVVVRIFSISLDFSGTLLFLKCLPLVTHCLGGPSLVLVLMLCRLFCAHTPCVHCGLS